jgi:transcriptional regulator with XRE-family HTH domain
VCEKESRLTQKQVYTHFVDVMVAKTINGQQETLGELIAHRLLELGWSNAELARRTGFSTTYIGNLARDVSPGTKTGRPKRIPDETVERIARALSVPIDRARTAAGLAKKERLMPDTIEQALDIAAYWEAKELDEKDKEKLRPTLQMLDREAERLRRLKHPMPKFSKPSLDDNSIPTETIDPLAILAATKKGGRR